MVQRLAVPFASVAAPLALLATLIACWPVAGGQRDLSGATFGHDFSMFWLAGRAALGGHAPEIYAPDHLHGLLREAFGSQSALFTWHYPPVFFLVVAAFARLPYPAAVLAWAMISLALAGAMLRLVLGSTRAMLVALAAPPVVTCLSYGQSGLLTASLLALGLLMVHRRPWIAGMFFGLVCFKPQLAILAPALMILTGRWRIAVAAGATAAITGLASMGTLGLAPWIAFRASLHETSIIILRDAWSGLALNCSAFGAARLLGASMAAAWSAQVAVSTVVVAITLVIWMIPCHRALQAAALLTAVPLMSPYVPEYDLAVLVPAGAFFAVAAQAGSGLTRGEEMAFVALWILALNPRGLTELTHCPFGFALACGAFALVVARAVPEMMAAAAGRIARLGFAAPVAGRFRNRRPDAPVPGA